MASFARLNKNIGAMLNGKLDFSGKLTFSNVLKVMAIGLVFGLVFAVLGVWLEIGPVTLGILSGAAVGVFVGMNSKRIRPGS